jgi:hypothetical protein
VDSDTLFVSSKGNGVGESVVIVDVDERFKHFGGEVVVVAVVVVSVVEVTSWFGFSGVRRRPL